MLRSSTGWCDYSKHRNYPCCWCPWKFWPVVVCMLVLPPLGFVVFLVFRRMATCSTMLPLTSSYDTKCDMSVKADCKTFGKKFPTQCALITSASLVFASFSCDSSDAFSLLHWMKNISKTPMGSKPIWVCRLPHQGKSCSDCPGDPMPSTVPGLGVNAPQFHDEVFVVLTRVRLEVESPVTGAFLVVSESWQSTRPVVAYSVSCVIRLLVTPSGLTIISACWCCVAVTVTSWLDVPYRCALPLLALSAPTSFCRSKFTI